MSSPHTPAFVLTQPNAGYDSPDRGVINHRYLTSCQVDSLVGFGALDGRTSLRSATPQACGVKFRETFQQMVFKVQSVTQEEQKEEKRHFKALIDLCVFQY